jgi:hypothetical protein
MKTMVKFFMHPNLTKSFTTSDKLIQVGVMHTTREPWLSIAKFGQLLSWETQGRNDFSVIYFYAKASRIASFLDKLIEKFRWGKNRYHSYAISYFLMAFFYPLRSYIPTADFKEEADSGIAARALKVNIPELTCTMRWKKIAFLQYFLEETSSEYTIIINSSSILNVKLIKQSLEQISRTVDHIYAGPIGTAHDCNFVSGAFTVLNRNSVKLLLDNLDVIPVHVMDDVCFGTAFKKLGINLINIDSLSIDSLQQLENTDAVNLSEYGHFRVKSGTLKNRNDIIIMKELISRLKKHKIYKP